MVHERDDVVGLDGSILMNRAVWEASGHEATFSDLMVECPITKRRYRVDQIEPQMGTILRYSGAADREALKEAIDSVFGDEADPRREKLEAQIREVGLAESLQESTDPVIRDLAGRIRDRINQGSRMVQWPEPFEVLVPLGKSREAARKTAIQFYRSMGLMNPTLEGETEEKLDKPTNGFSPDNGAKLTEPRAFNLMFKTYVGATEDESSVTYLRPETAQAIFVQFKNVLEVSRKKLPFGIAQIGKAFRNEINPRNFTFRSREFEQMELEYFCRAEKGMELLEYWKEERLKFYQNIGIARDKLHVLTVPDEERAFYSKGTYDIEYDFPFGRQELEGVAYRTDYDLSQHQKASGKSLEYFDEDTKQKFIPHVVEPSAGVDRTVLALICEAYSEDEAPDEKGKMETRTVLRFHPRIAPIKCAVFPLLKNKEPLVAKAKEIVDLLRPHMFVFYDESGAIGRRYRRQDEIGTPFGITVDFETLGEKDASLRDTVTLRERDSMKQERVAIKDLAAILISRIL